MWWCTCGTTHVQFSKIAAGKVLSCGTFRQAFFRYLLDSDSPKVFLPKTLQESDSENAPEERFRKKRFGEGVTEKIENPSAQLRGAENPFKTGSKRFQEAFSDHLPASPPPKIALPKRFRNRFREAFPGNRLWEGIF